MKVLIFGAGGMAGHMTAIYLKEAGHDVTGVGRRNGHFCKWITGDVRDQKCVEAAIDSDEFDIIVNAVGILNKAVDTSPADGIYINSVFPHKLSEYLQNRDTRLIHISSDCVFLGDKGGYTEKSVPDAVSYYGRTKVLGEICDNKNLTFRTSIVGPEIRSTGIGLFQWFMSQKREIDGFTEVFWTGVTTLELAKAIEAAMKQKLTGLYHLVNNQVISKYDLLCLFNQYMNQGEKRIRKEPGPRNDRSLINSRSDFYYRIPDYDQMLKELSVWINSHDDIYKVVREACKQN
ncbi:SDR family oxidoreductase [Hungatella hathewayi]|uniref:SDR family oxidoreductase n=1 Tax=Hungatella hathewayi TaxID=154046 RepID=UPI00356B2C56